LAATVYLGEEVGGRLFRYGSGITNISQTVGASTDYQLDVTTWDIVPATEVGDNVFRSIDVTFTCTNGYSVGITPIIDGVNLPEQTFNSAGTGEQQVQAFIAFRGARIAARVRTLTRSGDIELHDITTSFWTIRTNP
jgi:hypothetical protein